MAIFETTLQLIPSAPKLYIPKPTIAPTIVCVVETGHPLRLAIINHDPAANKEEIIPYISKSKFPVNNSGSITPFLIVCVTPPPARNAPRNSKIAAMRTA